MIRTVILSLLLITGCASNEVPQQIDNAYFDELFDAAFFEKSADPFQEMHQITTELGAKSDNPARFSNAFNVWYWEKHGRLMPNIIHYRDEEKTFFITVDITEGEKATANLRIEDGILHVAGQLNLKTRRFERMIRLDQRFPIPEGLDPLSTIAWSAGDKYTIRIDKLGS